MLDKVERLLNEQKEITDNIAYDIRSPLTRVSGEIGVALSRTRQEYEYVDVLESTHEEIENLQNMINYLLDISSMESAVTADLSTINVRELLESTIDIFIYAAEAKNISIELECDKSITWPLSKMNFKRAIANLLDNSIKYSPENSGPIVVRIESADKDLLLTIQDSGIGIPASDLDKVFTRYYRSEQSRQSKGNGLGLSLVKAVIASHGGTIEMSSATGAGTSCLITLLGQHSG